MKNLVNIALVLIVSLLVCRGQAFMWYLLNYEYISEELCINPGTECNGMCQLAEQVSRELPRDNSTPPLVQLEDVTWTSAAFYQLKARNRIKVFSTEYGIYSDPFTGNLFHDRIFRPPRR